MVLYSSGLDRLDLKLGVGLTMPMLTMVVLAALHLEDDHLLRAILRRDLSLHLGALDRGLADDGLFAADHEHFIELDRSANLTIELFDTQAVALAHAILFSTCLDDCVHGAVRIFYGPEWEGRVGACIVWGIFDLSREIFGASFPPGRSRQWKKEKTPPRPGEKIPHHWAKFQNPLDCAAHG